MKYHSNSSLGILLRHDIRVAFRNSSGMIYPLLFFIIAASLFPLAIGSETTVLKQVGGGIIWVMALLALQLPLPALFEDDYNDGTLEQLLMAGILPAIIAIEKIAAYWLVAVLPLIVAAPLLGIILMLETKAVMMLVLSLLLATPVLCLISGMTAALLLGTKKNSGLVFLIALPLTIPVLIFGAAAGSAETWELGKTALLALAGLFMIIAPITIAVCAAAIKQGK